MRMLEFLPCHKAILSSKESNVAELLAIIEANLNTIHDTDYHNRTVFDISIAMKCDQQIVLTLIKHSLPYDVDTEKEKPLSEHNNSWMQLVQLDIYHSVVENILDEYPRLTSLLVNFTDEIGRTGKKFLTIDYMFVFVSILNTSHLQHPLRLEHSYTKLSRSQVRNANRP